MSICSYLGKEENGYRLMDPSLLLEKQRRESPSVPLGISKLWEFVPGARGMLMGAEKNACW